MLSQKAPPTNAVDINLQFRNNNDEKEDKCMNLYACCGCLGCVLGVIILLGICGGSITWLVFAIKALTNISNEYIKDKCGSSDLWPLLLTIVIYTGASVLTQLMSSKSSEDKRESYHNEAIKLCLALGLLIWCGVELMQPCVQDKLTNNMIYVLLSYWFFFGCAMLGLIVCVCCGFIALGVKMDKKGDNVDFIYRVGV